MATDKGLVLLPRFWTAQLSIKLDMPYSPGPATSCQFDIAEPFQPTSPMSSAKGTAGPFVIFGICWTLIAHKALDTLIVQERQG